MTALAFRASNRAEDATMGISEDQRRALDKIAGQFEAEARAARPEIFQPAEGSAAEFRERIRAAALRLADHYCDRLLAEVPVATKLVASGAIGRGEAMADVLERIDREMTLRLAAERLQLGEWLRPGTTPNSGPQPPARRPRRPK